MHDNFIDSPSYNLNQYNPHGKDSKYQKICIAVWISARLVRDGGVGESSGQLAGLLGADWEGLSGGASAIAGASTSEGPASPSKSERHLLHRSLNPTML
jgi:hypothetical protein